jgi:type IV pilus assembly protein PilQ
MARTTVLGSLLAGGLLVVLAGCRTSPEYRFDSDSTAADTAPAASAPAPKPVETAPPPATAAAEPSATSVSSDAEPVRAIYSQRNDAELEEILNLARKSRWEEAEQRVEALAEKDPSDEAVQRVRSWVTTQRELRQAQNLEAAIREIDSGNSVFNPTIPELLKEEKDRGLPPRKDVRNALDQIESTPYVPPTYGTTNYMRGPLFSFESEQGRMQKILDKEISVQLDDAALEAIIFNVGQAHGINFVADKGLEAFKKTLSVNLDKVRLREFLNYVSRNMALQFQVGDDLIWIVDATDATKLYEETRFYRLRKGFVLPATFGPEVLQETRQLDPKSRQVRAITQQMTLNTFVNDEAPIMPSIESAITNFFTGKYYIDYERNLIVARATREQLEVLEKLIKEFDQAVQQVLIEARFITVSQPAFMSLGVIWETGRQFGAPRSPTDFTGLVSPDYTQGLGLGIQETFTNILGSTTLSATLTALEQSGESQTLSAPRLTVINNRPARISDGKVITERNAASAFVPSGKPTKLQAGVELDVMASISGDGESILLALNPKVSQDVKLVTFATLSDTDAEGNVTSTFDIRLPESRTQELATRVVVRSGETVAMGGVLEREQSTFVESVPVLGSIPLIGPLFRRRTEVDRPRFLLIFVTATILNERGQYVVYQDQER